MLRSKTLYVWFSWTWTTTVTSRSNGYLSYSAAVRSSAFSAHAIRRNPFVLLIIYDEAPAPGKLPCKALKQYNHRNRLNFSV
jgi:hypothetical protein